MSVRLRELVGCERPIQLAGMPGIATIELAAAVADAGGLGMIGAAMHRPSQLEAALGELRTRTRGAFGVNFLIPFLDPVCVDVAASRAALVEFFYGDPDPALVQRARRGGACVSWQVGSLEEARAAVAAGCDLIVVQGREAGGHVRGRSERRSLLATVRAAFDGPLLAAGGIGTPRDVGDALAAGADGVRIGTRFAAAQESGAHPDYVHALLCAGAEDTVLTEAFSTHWPDAPHRVLRSCVERAAARPEGAVGELEWGGRRIAIPRGSVIAPTRETHGVIEAMALYAGESVSAVRAVQPAAAIVEELLQTPSASARSACD
jgi:NAD(P)H-dependent flavin oxidoreductase YrpB (nitropropane dioxygenase family)